MEENASIIADRKISLEEEKKWLASQLAGAKKKEKICIYARRGKEIAGVSTIEMSYGRESHVGFFSIAVREKFRETGVEIRLAEAAIESAKRPLKPRLKILRLWILGSDKRALKVYSKYGFKKAAILSDQAYCNGELVDEIIMLLYV